jgi:hypothetical protein
MKVVTIRQQNVASNIFISLTALTLLPVIFLNFDTHHDGLIVQTVINLKDSIQNQGYWPFNQYGSFWIFPFTIGTWFLDSGSILIGIRVITLSCYWITGWLIYKAGLFYSSKLVSKWMVIYFFLSQPFFGGWNSSFLPWPSAIAMPLIVGAFYLLLCSNHNKVQVFPTIRIDIYFVILGIFMAMLVGTRLQIGALLTSFLLLFIAVYRERKHLILFVSSYVACIVLWCSYLYYNNWLADSFSDAVRVASTFLSGNYMHYPLPWATIGMSILISIVIYLCLKFNTSTIRKLFILLFPLLLVLSVFGLYLLSKIQNSQNELDNYIALLQRKVMAGLFFGSLIVGIALIIQTSYKSFRLTLRNKQNWILLFGFSLIASVQSWPFFDQMHIWWSSVPGLMIVMLLFNFLRIKFALRFKDIALSYLVLFILLLIPLISQFTDGRKQLESFRVNHVFGISKFEDDNIELAHYFSTSIPKRSAVLNLCPNADVFFVNLDYDQISRFPVYWANFANVPSIQQQLEFINPQYIVTCRNAYYGPKETIYYEMLQNKIILNQNLDYNFFSSYTNSGFKWSVYKVKNS